MTHRITWWLAFGVAGTVALALVVIRPPGPDEGQAAPAGPGEGERILTVAAETSLPPTEPDEWRVHSGIHAASDVAPAGGGWLVLDAPAHRVHLLDGELALRRTFGGPGDGPGELSAPAAVAVSVEGLVGVVDLTGATVDLFDVEGAFVDRVRAEPRPCPVAGIVRDLLPHPGGGFVIDIDCTGASGREWVVARVGADGAVARLAAAPLADPLRAVLEGGRGVAFRDGGVWLVGPDGCMRSVEGRAAGAGGGAAVRQRPALCLPAAEPVAIPDSLRRELRAVAGARDGRPGLTLPPHFPPVLSVGWSPVGPVFTTPPDPDAGALAILPPRGGLRRVKGVGRGHVGRDALLLVRTFMEGTGFYAVPWSRLFGPGAFGPDPAPERTPGPGGPP